MVFISGLETLIDFFSFITWTVYGAVMFGLLLLRWRQPNLKRPYKVSGGNNVDYKHFLYDCKTKCNLLIIKIFVKFQNIKLPPTRFTKRVTLSIYYYEYAEHKCHILTSSSRACMVSSRG